MKGQENAVNTFKDGLLMDTNPLSNDGTSLTNALNATLTTNNGNELMLQNDMGNGRINKVRLDEGYIPVGIKEHGGIIYIASYNPETRNGQIGSFPYPKVEYDANVFENNETPLTFIYQENGDIEGTSVCTGNIIFNQISHSSQKIELFITTNEEGEQVQAKFKQGDYFSLTFDSKTSEYLKADNIEASIVSKTTSDYVTLYTISKDELLTGGTTIAATYNYPYSGTLFLQISLNVPDTFDISYKYDNGQFIIYPYAYNSQNEDIYTTSAIVNGITNFNCGPSITLSEGTYDIYPITSDKGYLNYLKQKLILNPRNKNNIFKYSFNEGLLDLYWDIFTIDYQESNEGNYRFTYNFYPLESASSVRSLQALQQLPYTKQVIRDGYSAISGLRNLKCTLPEDTIYVLLVTVANTQDNVEIPCFGGFIYGTPRYNENFEDEDCYNFNNIDKVEEEVSYTFNRQLLELNRKSITNRHLIQNKWEETQGVVLFSDTLIPAEVIPEAYSSEIAVSITKTEEPIVVAPKQNVKFIYDSDQFSVESAKFNINLNNATINDVPETNKGTRIITSYDPNDYLPPVKEQDSITFYRYISSEGNDGQAQQTRTFKQLMPIFNPGMLNYEELFGFDFTDSTTTGVFGSKHYLNMTENISLTIDNISGDIGTENKLLGDSEGNSTPSIIKQFLLMHSKDYRGQDISSIFDLFGGATKEDWEIDYASLRIKDKHYIPYKRFGGLESKDVRSDEFAEKGNYIIPSCLTYTNQPLLLPLPSADVGICYSEGYIKEENGKYSSRDKYPKNVIVPAHRLGDRTQDLLIPAFKKLFCLLSQIFTLQEQESYIYVIGPSEVTINYNVQDNSYIKYDVALQQDSDIFIDDGIQENLNNIKNYLLNSPCLIPPNNYIARIKLKKYQEENYFFYGRDVNMDSALYNNILSQYITAYDDATVIDNSAGYSGEDIYYLDSKKLWDKYKNDTAHSIQSFDYDAAHRRIIEHENYPLDQNGELVTDGDYNKIWPDYDIQYNPIYNCYQYDLSKANFISLLTKSTLGNPNYLLDWAGNCWKIPSLINTFMTIEEAKNTSGSQISSYSNNFIVLRILNTVSSDWVKTGDAVGPAFAKIDLGFRGNQYGYTYEPIGLNFLIKITEKIQNIINLYNHNQVATTGRYLEYSTPTTPYIP